MTPASVPPGRAGYRPVLGPVNRVSFLAEQAQNRRASSLLALFACMAVILTSIPVGVIAAPLFYIAMMPIGFVMTTIHPHSEWALLLVLPATLLPMLFGLAFQRSNVTLTDPEGVHVLHGFWPAVIATLVLTVLPGALVFLVLWLVVRVVLRRAGVAAILAKLGARAPDLRDDEEHQLVDVVQEIAVAAGIPAPHVAIIDAAAAGGAANAAAVGWSIGDATVVVTRPLLDLLTRDQIQAVVARVVASIGNGDLRIAFLMLSIFRSVRIVQFALFGVSRARTLRVLWRCVRLALRRPAATDADRSSEQVVAADLWAVDTVTTRIDVALQPPRSPLGCLFAPVLLPLRFSGWTLGFIISASEYMVTGPLVDATWRRRELLADATAVQLTRDPDGLAGALERLRGSAVMLPQADALSYLFAAWWPAPSGSDPAGQPINLFARKTHVSAQRRLAQLVAIGAHSEPAAYAPGTQALTSTSSASALDESSIRSVLMGFVALAFVNIVGAMMWIAIVLTSIELFVLGFVGLWAAQRFGLGPH